jgi:hypothetical protein
MKKIIVIILFAFLFHACDKEKIQLIEKQEKQIHFEEGFCYLKNVEQVGDSLFATVDFIEHRKTADVGNDLAKTQIIELPNGFCFTNEIVELDKFEIADSVLIIMQTFSHDVDGNFKFNQKIELAELIKLFNKSNENGIPFSPFRIKLENKIITLLTEIYIP